jgi:hypothetical protein
MVYTCCYLVMVDGFSLVNVIESLARWLLPYLGSLQKKRQLNFNL